MAAELTPESVRAMLEAATPGPWTAELDTDNKADRRNWREVYNGNKPVVVSDFYERHSAGETETVCGVRVTAADASLLASAPDLARALLAAWEERDRLRALAAAYVAADRAMYVTGAGNDVGAVADAAFTALAAEVDRG